MRNPYLGLYEMARRLNDWRAVNSATLARDLFDAGARHSAEQHATMARRRLRKLATPGDVATLAESMVDDPWNRCPVRRFHGERIAARRAANSPW